ncbi:MAG: Rqc2 family fibronectin-binding protein [Oscillospiraceae bacterium]|jgi:predicted ribosome quality control (RQC) complex YloA/Tae2 family protein
MPLDAVCLSALTRELSERIVGMRIDKIQQPERDLLLLSVRGKGDSGRLLLSAGSGSARIHFTEASFENPQQAPMFCMLLRKHLTGARILSLTQPNLERMVVMELDTLDELGVQSKKRLILELIGRNTNIILVGADDRIIECVRRVDGDMSRSRQLLPGLIYRLPPEQEKLAFFSSTAEQRRVLWEDAIEEGQAVDKWLLHNFSNLSPLICREVCHRAFGEAGPMCSSLTAEQRSAFRYAMDALAETVKNREFVPYMLLEGDKPRDFSFLPINQYGSAMTGVSYPNFSTLLDGFYTRRDKMERMRHRAQSLTKTVKNARDRAARKLTMQLEEKKTTENRDTLRKYGDLITGNLYRMTKGMTVLHAEDYYEEDCPEIEIPLDPLKTPQQNAAAYYKEYNKAKTAERYLVDQIAEGESKLEYLESVLEEISRAEGERDLGEIRGELISAGFIRPAGGGKKERIKESGPLTFRSSHGMEILVGRNNAQNDALTTKQARRTDVWLHTQRVHGSHVIIRCEGEEPDEQTLQEAASLAVYYSQGREGGKTAVDYTQVRFVKKPHGALPGKVIYTEYRTIMAEGDEVLVARLRTTGKIR